MRDTLVTYVRYLLVLLFITTISCSEKKDFNNKNNTKYEKIEKFNQLVIQNKDYNTYIGSSNVAIKSLNSNVIDFYKKKKLNNESFYEKGKEYLENNLIVLDTNEKLCIDSSYAVIGSSNLWNFHFHSFNLVRNLIASYSYSDNKNYLYQAYDFIYKWAEKYTLKKNILRYSWSDHSSANRLFNLVMFYNIAGDKLKNQEKMLVISLIKLHIDVMAMPEFFSSNHNHGVFQAYYLYLASKQFEDLFSNAYVNIAKERIVEIMQYNYSDSGVHVENSPYYHYLITDQFIEIDYILKYFNDHIPEIENTIEKAIVFLAIVFKPDNSLPLMGDGHRINYEKLLEDSLWKDYKNFQFLQYSLTKGGLGKVFKGQLFHFQEAGYAIFTNKYSNMNYAETEYIVIKSGFLSNVHRHDDDLSFTYFNFGQDWFIDCGKYIYENKNPIRKYLISSSAHNMVSIDSIKATKKKKIANPKLLLHTETQDQYQLNYLSGIYPVLFQYYNS